MKHFSPSLILAAIVVSLPFFFFACSSSEEEDAPVWGQATVSSANLQSSSTVSPPLGGSSSSQVIIGGPSSSSTGEGALSSSEGNEPSSSSVVVAVSSSSVNNILPSSSAAAPSSSAAAPSSSAVAPSSSAVAPSSSAVTPSSSAVAPSSSAVTPSSSAVAPSSSAVAPSSSAVAPSSSAVTPSSSATAPTITCTVAKSNVTQGENIASPTITCSAGAMVKTSAVFAASPGALPTDVNNWKTTGNAYYDGTVTGSNAIGVAGVTCGGVEAAAVSCGSITVAKPTCSGATQTVTTGTAITQPSASCGNASATGATFNYGADYSGGSYSTAGSKAVSLTSVSCDGHSISGVNASCGTVTVTAAEAESTCGAYTGVNSAGKSWSDICPNTQWSAVKWNTKPTNTAGCYYVQSVDGDINMNGSPDASCYFRTNGTCRNGQISGSGLGKIDGGVYIYVPTGTGWNNNPSVTLGGKPFCTDGVHDLFCNTPSNLAAGTSVDPSGFVTCRSEDVPTGIVWTGAPNWSNLEADSYTGISVSAVCGSTALSKACGNITVSAPVEVTIAYQGSGIALDAGTVYNVTYSGGGSVLRCTTAPASGTEVGTYGGQNIKIGNDNNRIVYSSSGNNVAPLTAGTSVIIAPSVNLGGCFKDW